MGGSSFEERASSSSDSPYTGEWKHDVFVCFRGKDTRDNITSHLAGHLRHHGLRVFTDDMLERTEPIDNLLSIVATSAMSIVIFSENFAESSYCLDEVATIAEQMENFGHRVLPVFYKVNPDNVSDDSVIQCGSFASIARRVWHNSLHKPTTYAYVIDTNHKPDIEQKRRWMLGLKAVATCAGRTTDEFKDELELCNKIAEHVLQKLNNLVGMETRIIKVQKLLATNDGTSNDTHVIGLWGMAGVGKTTLATSVYQRLTSPTNGIKHHFFASVGASDVNQQVRELYSTLLSQNNLSLVDLERLSRLKVVVVLDNVETEEDLEKLLLGGIRDPTKLFGPGSIIIITSRDRRVLNHANARIYDVEALNSSESLELFSLHAFRQSCPSGDLMDLSCQVILQCKGNPGAIIVLGIALWKKYWKRFVSGLEDIPDPDDLFDDVFDKVEHIFSDALEEPIDFCKEFWESGKEFKAKLCKFLSD